MTVPAQGPSDAAVAFDAAGDALAIQCSLSSGSMFAIGATTVTCSATDAAGRTATGSFTVTVTPITPPVITGVSVSASCLWPADHNMVDVSVSYAATSASGPVTCGLSVTSNEAVLAKGSGHRSPDWIVVTARNVQLRAERSGTGTDRVYNLAITCKDAFGNTSVQDVPVSVPHDGGC
jgi:hypothetical protein